MAFVLFTPAFDGDEYHATGFDCTEEGVFEVDEDRADYLAEAHPDRFDRCTVENEESSDAVVAKMEAETGLQTPEADEAVATPENEEQTPETPVAPEVEEAPPAPAKKGKK